MKIKIKYYASLREQAQKSEEVLEVSSNKPEDIYDELKKKYGFTLDISELQIAVNDNYEDINFELKDSDTIVFIPPVAGG